MKKLIIILNLLIVFYMLTASIAKIRQGGTVTVDHNPYVITLHYPETTDTYEVKFAYKSSTSYLIKQIVINNQTTREISISVIGKSGEAITGQKISWFILY